MHTYAWLYLGFPDVLSLYVYYVHDVDDLLESEEVSRKAEKWTIRNGGCFCILVAEPHGSHAVV
jgi:hypothetical protein